MRDNTKFKRLFPNTVTMLALAFGVSSINMAYWGQWRHALLCILLAGVFDFLDGKVARLFGVSSKFGMQLDTLSDFISFGVAPGFIMYQWTLNPELKLEALKAITEQVSSIGGNWGVSLVPITDKVGVVGVNWGVVLFLAMCCAMRLARFNVMEEKKTPEYWKNYFLGVPAPAGAFLALFPLLISFSFDQYKDFFHRPEIVATFMIFSGIMMVSRIPTMSMKHIHIPDRLFSYLRIILLAVIAALICMPWKVLFCFVAFYICSIPVSYLCFRRTKKKYMMQTMDPNSVIEDVPNEF